MNKNVTRRAAAALLCACLIGQTPGLAVSLTNADTQYTSVLKKADSAGLLPESMDGTEAEETLTRAQLSALAVRLYASLRDMEYDELAQDNAERSAACPYTDTQDEDVRLAWVLGLTSAIEDGQYRPDEPATRQMLFCVLYRAAVKTGCAVTMSDNEIAETLYANTDGDAVASWAREGTAYFLREGIAEADDTGAIAPDTAVTAEQAAVMTYRMASGLHTGRGLCSAEELDTIATHSGSSAVSWNNNTADFYRVYFYRQNDYCSEPTCIEQVSGDGSGAQELALEDILEETGTWYWSVDAFDCSGRLIATSKTLTELTVSDELSAEEALLQAQEEKAASAASKTTATTAGESVIIETIPAGMTYSGESYGSRVARIFGEGASYHKYASSTEAASHQVTVTVPVWNLDSDGNKVTRMASFQVHEALAATVLQIFTEIYQGEEQFPIYSVGGYCWRGDESTSEHCLGTAIDINPNENYMCTNSGKALTGTHWSPGEDPYSIPADGEVVRIFAKYGFGWGGTWNSKKDYMHFSYFGT